MHRKDNHRELEELCVVANFVEIFLAREGHSNPVGINYLEKIQIPHLPQIYGAMLAGVEYVLMGAGIPMRIPGVLDRFVNHEPATYPLTVTGALEGDDTTVHFNPREFMECDLPRIEASAVSTPSSRPIPWPPALLRRSNWQSRWLHHRGPDGRRAQCAAARKAANRSTRRIVALSTATAMSWTSPKSVNSEYPSGSQVVSAVPKNSRKRSPLEPPEYRWERL